VVRILVVRILLSRACSDGPSADRGADGGRLERLADGGGSVLVVRWAAIGSVMTSLSFRK
jgi:hypothetical protein